MADAPKLSINKLKDIVSDAEELSKGTRLFDDKGLDHLSRFEGKLFADAKGSGASPYKVQIVFEDGKMPSKGRCSCMAARSRPFCKHACALMVAWARAPESFAVADVAPAAGSGDGKKKEVKKGKTEVSDLMKHGVEQVGTLVRELAVAGVASLAADRAGQIRALGESLRESKLRRLSARTIDLANKLDQAAKQSESFDATDYAELLSDMLLTVRKLEKHLAGEALDEKYVEELIGTTWTKKDRKPISGLDLVEYAFVSRVTADDFVIRESRFLCIATGEQYSEKQIIPGFLAKRTEPKKSWTGRVLRGALGSIFPSFSPVRLSLETPGTEQPLANAAVEVLLKKCLPDVGAALVAFQERRKDVFAPDMLPVAIAVDTILAEGARMQVVDKADGALFLPDDPGLEERMAAVLRGSKLKALLGDVAIDGALPTLFPLAVVVEGPIGHELRTIGGGDAAALRGAKKVRATAATSTQRKGSAASAWADTARAAGASTAAISLGEIREELAQSLTTGLTGLVARFTDPLVSRLKELGLEKQGEVLKASAAKTDAAEKLDDFVKLYQVLGIALTRLSGAAHVDRKTLEAVPTYESVYVKKAEKPLEPKEIAALSGQGKINRYQAAVHYARYYENIPAEQLAASIYPTWADGSASPYVARAFAGKGKIAIDAARKALGLDAAHEKSVRAWYRPHARVARITAVRVLEAVGSKEAQDLLLEVIKSHSDMVLRSYAARALRSIKAANGVDTPVTSDTAQKEFIRYRDTLLSGSTKEDRISALRNLVKLGNLDAIPYLRASFAGDVSSNVREEAAYALGKIGDVESCDTFVRMLRRRAEDEDQAKIGAYALGHLGDVRGIDELLNAWEGGWNKPGILADSIKEIGTAALEPLLDRIEKNPSLAERTALKNIVSAISAEDVAESVCSRIEAHKADAKYTEIAGTLVAVAKEHDSAMKAYAKKCVTLWPVLLDKGAGKEEKALAKKLAKFL